MSKKRTVEIIIYIIFLWPIYLWALASEVYDMLKTNKNDELKELRKKGLIK